MAPTVGVNVELVQGFFTQLTQEAQQVLAEIESIRTTYMDRVVSQQGLVGNNEKQLTEILNGWIDKYKPATAEALNDFGTTLKDAANRILAAGGNDPSITYTPVTA